jgi:hypothetical protein
LFVFCCEVLTPSGSAIKGSEAQEVSIEITVTWSLILPTPAEMRIRHLGKNLFQRWILSGGIMSAFAKKDSSVHSGRRQASAEQNDGRTPFHRPQIPAVMPL